MEQTKIKPVADEQIKLTVILPVNAYFLSGVRDFTMTIVENMTGFSRKWAFRFQSIVDELVNNAIEYGTAPTDEVKIIFISTKGKKIEIFVEDKGTGQNKKRAADLRAFVDERRHLKPTDFTSLRGRGLTQIIANWTDVLEFIDNEFGGITVHVIKNIESGENA